MENEIKQLICKGEKLDLEFKSDLKCLPDRDLVGTVVSLSNTQGGDLLLGVEDSGEITGLNEKHLDISGIPPLIANKTIPSISVRVFKYEVKGKYVARIIVPKSRQLVSTTSGTLLRRRIKIDGTPETVPFYPHEFVQRYSSLGVIDPSFMAFEDVNIKQLDSLQRERIRKAIEKYGGDRTLLPLADEEFDGALGLCRDVNGVKRPTISGLLFLGTEDLLRENIPTYEVAFQVLQGTDVKVNKFFRKPLLETFEEIELLFEARVEEEEIQIGLFRVSVPNFDRRAFREAFVNALVHRDFSRQGAVHVRISEEGLYISNPGGFIEGVTLNNLLITDPRSRNPVLADVIKRIGLAERTGRGIDRIYEGMLRYGRSAPDYSKSSETTVSVQMVNSAPDFDFLKMVIEQEDKFGIMPVDSLIILSRLREERRLTISDLIPSVQKSETNVRSTLEKLVERGFIKPHGSGRGRTYTLSSRMYKKKGKQVEYIRQTGFDKIQQEQMIINYINENGKIKRSDVMELCHLSGSQAYRLLRNLTEKGIIKKNGERRYTFYTM